jgi:hypothetical protein
MTDTALEPEEQAPIASWRSSLAVVLILSGATWALLLASAGLVYLMLP